MGAGCHKDVSWFRSEFFLSLFNECGTPLQQVAAHEVEHITIGYGTCVAGMVENPPVGRRDHFSKPRHGGNVRAGLHEVFHADGEACRLVEPGKRVRTACVQEVVRAGMVKIACSDAYGAAYVVGGE